MVQLVAHQILDLGVLGSSPSRAAIKERVCVIAQDFYGTQTLSSLLGVGELPSGPVTLEGN